jgi:hypothetical protein
LHFLLETLSEATQRNARLNFRMDFMVPLGGAKAVRGRFLARGGHRLDVNHPTVALTNCSYPIGSLLAILSIMN